MRRIWCNCTQWSHNTNISAAQCYPPSHKRGVRRNSKDVSQRKASIVACAWVFCCSWYLAEKTAESIPEKADVLKGESAWAAKFGPTIRLWFKKATRRRTRLCLPNVNLPLMPMWMIRLPLPMPILLPSHSFDSRNAALHFFTIKKSSMKSRVTMRC